MPALRPVARGAGRTPATSCSSACCARSRHLAIVRDDDGTHRRPRDARGSARGARRRHSRRARRARAPSDAVTATADPHDRLLARFRRGQEGRARARRQHRRESSRRASSALLARAAPATRPRAAHRHHRAAGRGEEHAHHRARARAIARRASRSASSPSIPTSPFTGGALLGDRIRMEDVALDPGVFIRSMATRGSLGGLAGGDARESATCSMRSASIASSSRRSASARASSTSRARPTRRLVVLVPESGDSIQTLKAGLMEIADVFVVNKADRPGADRLRNEIELMLGLRARRDDDATCRRTTASISSRNNRAARRCARRRARDDADALDAARAAHGRGEGRGDRRARRTALDRHFRYLEQSGTLRERRRARLRERVVEVVEDEVRRRLWSDAATNALARGAAARARGRRRRRRSRSPTRCSRGAPTF